jgi:hypothetical protein
VAYGRTVRRGGSYNRLAEPSWVEPLDTSYSTRGGRWNPPDTFGVLYLNRDVRTARLQVLHKLQDQPYGIEDLDEAELHDLVNVRVEERQWLDCITNTGLGSVGLPATYPRYANHRTVRREACWPVGQAAFQDGKPGIACRSAATGASPTNEELAVFDRDVGATVRLIDRQPFAEWFWGSVA